MPTSNEGSSLSTGEKGRELLEKKVTKETTDIQQEKDVQVRKEKRRTLSWFKKLLKFVKTLVQDQ